MAASDQYFQALQKAQNDDRRAFERACVLVSAQMSDLADHAHATDCIVFDLSANGAKVRLDGPLTGDHIKRLTLSGAVDYEVELAWNYGVFIGLKFLAKPELVAESLIGVLPNRCLEF